MTAMSGNQNLFRRFTRQEALAVAETAVFQSGLNNDLILVFRQRIQLSLAQTKSPFFPVVRRAVRNPVRVIRQGVQVLLQLPKRNLHLSRNAVVDDVQIRVPKIDNAIAARVLDVGIPNIPFAWDSPVKHLGSACHLLDLKRNSFSDSTKSLTKPIPRDAPADGVEFRCK